jgi:hypothetical protein
VKLTPDDLRRVGEKAVANIIRKIVEEKRVPTAREEAILAKHASGETVEVQTPGTPSGFAKTYEELAEACHVDRRTLTNARKKFGKQCPKPRADGRHEIAAWIRFLSERGIEGRGENNPAIDFIDERELRLEERKLRVERERFELRKAKDELIPIAHAEAALGAMLAKFRQTLDSLPGRIAGGIDEADRAEILRVLASAEKAKLTFKQLRAQIEKGKVRPFADIHARREFVQVEVDQVLTVLSRCDYLAPDPDADDE